MSTAGLWLPGPAADLIYYKNNANVRWLELRLLGGEGGRSCQVPGGPVKLLCRLLEWQAGSTTLPYLCTCRTKACTSWIRGS